MCVKEDPLHGSGHVAQTTWLQTGQRNMFYVGWWCPYCGKIGRTQTLVRR